MSKLLTMKRIVAGLSVIAALFAVASFVPAIESRADLDSSILEDRFIYRVERDGAVVGFFTEISGLGSENEIVEYREGGENAPPRKLVGGLTYGDITLRRPISRDLTIWNWRQEVVNEESPQSAVTVTMLRRTGAPVVQWDFVNAWPAKIEGPSFKADGNGIPTETITLAVEKIERVH